MTVICQDAVGRCSFIDVVADVVTENHEDYAIFRTHHRVPVTEIAATTRCDPHQRR